MEPKKKDSEFRRWADTTGLTAETLRHMLGLGRTAFSERMNGYTEPTESDRLAMAAITVGLPPWTPETMAELQSYATAVSRQRLAAMESPPSAS